MDGFGRKVGLPKTGGPGFKDSKRRVPSHCASSVDSCFFSAFAFSRLWEDTLLQSPWLIEVFSMTGDKIARVEQSGCTRVASTLEHSLYLLVSNCFIIRFSCS